MEDGDEVVEEFEAEDVEEEEAQQKSTKPQEKKKACNQRIDQLSTPQKRMFLALWNDHAHHLSKDKVKNLKMRLQELYALTPEETAKYFAELRAENEAAALRQKMKQRLRRYLLERHHREQKERAYRLFKKILKCGMMYAVKNPVSPLVSKRLRYLSDIILEQLCDLRKIYPAPFRRDTDKLENLLISIADWMAIAVERLYYAAQLSIDEMINEEETLLVDDTFDDSGQPTAQTFEISGQPVGQSTPKRPPTDYSFDVSGQPVGQSTPKRPPTDYSFDNSVQPVGQSTPKRPPIDHTFETTGYSTMYDSSLGNSTLPDQFAPPGTSTPQKLSLDDTQQSNPYYAIVSMDPIVMGKKKTKPKNESLNYTTKVISDSHQRFNQSGFEAPQLPANSYVSRSRKPKNRLTNAR